MSRTDPLSALQEEIVDLLAMDDETAESLAEMLGSPVPPSELHRALEDLERRSRVHRYPAGYADKRRIDLEATWWSVRSRKAP